MQNNNDDHNIDNDIIDAIALIPILVVNDNNEFTCRKHMCVVTKNSK